MATPGQGLSQFTVFTELVSTTYRNHKKEVADNVSNHNALYRRLKAKDRIRTEDGGLSIVAILDYGDNSTYQRYSGYDPLNVSAVEVITSAEYPWRQAAVHVAANGLEIRSNSGENRIVNFVKTKLKNAQRSFANGISGDLYSNGTASNQINGLQALIADAGTGTVGGIDSGTYDFWQNTVQSAAAPLIGSAITLSETTFERFMAQAYNRITRGSDQPDLGVFSEDYFAFFEQSQVSLKRYASSEKATAGIASLKYKNADVFFDTAASGISAAHGYFANTDYFEMVVHEDANMEIFPEMRAINQDAIVIPILFQGNLVCSNRSLQAVLKA